MKHLILVLLGLLLWGTTLYANESVHGGPMAFPPALDSYNDADLTNVSEILDHRISQEPLNLWVTIIFACAILHTFVATKFQALGHHFAHEHAKKLEKEGAHLRYDGNVVESVSFSAEICHFLGEVEAIFGLWAILLFTVIAAKFGFGGAVAYMGSVSFTEPMFVVVIMSLAATRPVIELAKKVLGGLAGAGGRTPAAWWFTILTVAPLLGSFITEPGAMTIGALLLSRQFYALKPTKRFAFATIGLLFVNVSVGGTMTHFAAPPVLMVAGKWGWDMPHMLLNFGWKAALGILLSNLLYFIIFRSDFAKLEQDKPVEEENRKPIWEDREEPIPAWVTIAHLGFMGWAVFTAHHPPLFIGGFLFCIGFLRATAHHQHRFDLKPSLMVGFFLAGLVVHGGVQAWWIAPILSSLGEVPLMLGATFLTAFNDNAAITYLASLVPGFSDSLKYAVVAGAVTGGGFTVIANAPNPAGQSILSKHFDEGVTPLWLAVAATVPTIIVGCCFMLL